MRGRLLLPGLWRRISLRMPDSWMCSLWPSPPRVKRSSNCSPTACSLPPASRVLLRQPRNMFENTAGTNAGASGQRRKCRRTERCGCIARRRCTGRRRTECTAGTKICPGYAAERERCRRACETDRGRRRISCRQCFRCCRKRIYFQGLGCWKPVTYSGTPVSIAYAGAQRIELSYPLR